MSATTVYDGLAERYATIAGIDAESILLGEPTAIQAPPALYTAYLSFTRPLRSSPPARNITGMLHLFATRLVIRWQENAEAEAQMLSLLDAIPDAIDADPHLGGRLSKGMAYCDAGVAGYVTISGTLYRFVDYTITALEKREAL